MSLKDKIVTNFKLSSHKNGNYTYTPTKQIKYYKIKHDFSRNMIRRPDYRSDFRF